MSGFWQSKAGRNQLRQNFLDHFKLSDYADTYYSENVGRFVEWAEEEYQKATGDEVDDGDIVDFSKRAQAWIEQNEGRLVMEWAESIEDDIINYFADRAEREQG